MKKTPTTRFSPRLFSAISALLATALPVALFAAIPQHWTVETSRVQPAQFEAFHGETIEFAATMQSYGKPLAITNDLIGIYWQTNGMGSAYWTAPAVLSNNVMIARWEPSMDVGANVYSCFIGAPGEIYRAAFQLRLRPSPGAVPSELPLPVQAIDFSQVEVRNAPWLTTESDPTVPSWAKATAKPSYSAAEVGVTMGVGAQSVAMTVGTNVATMPTFDFMSRMMNYKQDTISDLASIRSGAAAGATAVQHAAISDMETKTHAAATYQPKGSYLTSESDPTVYPWAKATTKPSYSWSEIGSKPTFAAVATSGAYSDLTGKPSIPTDSTVAGWGYIKSWTETDPTVATTISNHNSSNTAHQDIRQTMGYKYSKPSSGIPKSDLASAVQTSLGKADTAVQPAAISTKLDKEYVVDPSWDPYSIYWDESGLHIQCGSIYLNSLRQYGDVLELAGDSWNGLVLQNGTTLETTLVEKLDLLHESDPYAHADIREEISTKAEASDLATLAANVSTWSSFWSGDDVRVTVTNYDSAVNLPSLYLEYKLSNGTFRTVWDERTRWDINDRRMAAVESAIEGKADRAWGYYDSHTGGWAPDGYTWLSSPKIAISGGLAYQKHVTSEGAVWVLESNGLIAESGGVMSNGFFRISDDEGNPLFEIVKGDKRTVGATAGSCETLAGFAITHLQIGYAVESADHPKIYVTRSLTPVDWKAEDDADCPATVSWSGSSGNWTAVVAGKVAEARLFVKAEYEVGGNTYIKQSAPVSVQKLVLGGREYRVGTATISGHTVLTLTLEP